MLLITYCQGCLLTTFLLSLIWSTLCGLFYKNHSSLNLRVFLYISNYVNQLIAKMSNLIRLYVPHWNLSLTTWWYVYKWFQIWRRPNSPWQLQFIFPRPWWGFLCMSLICVFAWAAIFCYQYLICLLQRWNYSNLYVFWGDQNMVWNL